MKLSIITINYNNLEGLRKTINSVVSQTWRDFEWIVVDGGSADGSRELIEEYAAKGCFSWWCSEPDKGIYNAMNKGLLHVDGDYVQFLNSGDCYTDSNVLNDFSLIEHDKDIISGDIIIDGDVNNYRTSPDESELDYEFMVHKTILHPSSFVRKEVFLKCGTFDESLRIVADWKFFLVSLIQYSCSYKRWVRIVVNFDGHGLSESKESYEIIAKERKFVLNNFLPYVQKTISKKEWLISILNIPSLKRIKISLAKKIQLKLHHFLSLPCKFYLKQKSSMSKNKQSVSTEKIIVSMTSWKKRINNVPETIKSILINKTLPDFIVINLSIEEFPNKELDLPKELLKLKANNDIRINWLKGNDKAFKKIIPTLKQYPNDVIIAIDDDFIYPNNFIETFVNQHKETPQYPLSGNSISIGVQAHCGCASLVKACYFGQYLCDLIDETVIEYGMDDIFYTYCAVLNGVKYRYVGKSFFYNMIPNNSVDPLSGTHKYGNLDMISYLNKKVLNKYNIDLGQLSEPMFCWWHR